MSWNINSSSKAELVKRRFCASNGQHRIALGLRMRHCLSQWSVCVICASGCRSPSKFKGQMLDLLLALMMNESGLANNARTTTCMFRAKARLAHALGCARTRSRTRKTAEAQVLGQIGFLKRRKRRINCYRIWRVPQSQTKQHNKKQNGNHS